MLKTENDELRAKLDHMNEILLNMQRARFGQSSEKQKYISPDQLSIFNKAELEQDPKAPEPDEKTIIVPEHKRKPKGSLEDRIMDLPAEDVILELDEEEAVCGHCGNTLRKMGKKFIRREIEVIQKSIKVINYYVYTYTCDNCEKNEGVSRIYSIHAPESLIKHSYASPFFGSRRDDSEVRGRYSFGAAGEDMAARGLCAFKSDDGELDHQCR